MIENPNKKIEFDKNSLEEIYFAGGCFWGVDAYMARVLGVYETECGYANGNTENPTYEAVCHENTGHAETVRIIYDKSKVSLEELFQELFSIIDPTSFNKQAGDVGAQYRTGIYFTEQADGEAAKAFIEAKQKDYDKPIVTEVLPLENFYLAEEYHQNYLEKNPGGYCHVDLSKFAK